MNYFERNSVIASNEWRKLDPEPEVYEKGIFICGYCCEEEVKNEGDVCEICKAHDKELTKNGEIK